MTPRKSLRKRLILTALAGTGLSLAVVQAPAQAAGNWDLTGTGAGVAGAHAYGNVYRRGDNRVQVTGTLKDTDQDGKLAIVKLHATYADGGRRDERDVTGSSKALGSEGGYNFASSVRTISAMECLGHKTASGAIVEDHCASSWYRIW
jgi:hypothetical protein